MTQKTKNYLLLTGIASLWLLAYYFAFSRTYVTYTEKKTLEMQKKSFQSAPKQQAVLAQKEKQLNSILAQHHIEGSSLQQTVFKTLQTLSEKLEFEITDFQQPHEFTPKDTKQTVTTYSVTLQGDYKSILKAIHTLEQDYSFGTIAHVFFERKRNFRTRRNYLQCQILIQRLT